jgi:hypothetical protein
MNYRLPVRLVLLLLTLFTSVLVLTSLYSATQIQILSPSSVQPPTLIGETISSSLPITIRNNGMYDIENISIYISIENSSRYTLFRNITAIPRIAARSQGVLAIGFALNLTKLIEEKAYVNFFRDDNFTVDAHVTCKYTLGLIGFGMNLSQTMPWSAPIDLDSFMVVPRIDEIALGFSSGNVTLTLPVDVFYSGWLNLRDIEVATRVHNSSGVLLTSALTKVPNMNPGTNRINVGMVFPVNASRSLLTQDQELTVDASVRVFGFELVSESLNYSWAAPLSGLNFTSPMLSPVNATHMRLQMGMEGRNNSPVSISDCTVQIQVFNSTNALVGSNTTSFSLAQGPFSENFEVIFPVGSTPGSWMVRTAVSVEGFPVGSFEREVP